MLQSFLFLTFSELIFNISNYLLQIGLGRILGAADYGRVTLVLGLTTMLTILLARGVSTAMSKRLSERSADPSRIRAIRRSAATLQCYITLSVTALFFLAAPLIAQLLRDLSLAPLFRLSSMMIATFVASGFFMQYFNGIKDFTAMSILKAARGPYRLLCILLGAFFYGVPGAILGAVAAPLFLSLTGFVLDRLRHSDIARAPLTERYSATKLLNYAAGFMLFLLCYEFYVRTDLYVIKYFTGDDALVGIYNAAMAISLIPYYLCIALSFVLFPMMSKLSAQNDTAQIRLVLNNTLRLLWTALIGITVLMAVYAQQIITLLFGTTFVSGGAFIPLLMPGAVFGTIFYVLLTVFNGTDRTKLSAILVATGIVLLIALNASFLPLYGVTATAIIFSAVNTLLGTIAMLVAYRLFGARLSLRALFVAPCLGALLYYAATSLPHHGWSFIVSGALLFVIYLGCASATDLVRKTDFTRKKNSTS